MGPLTTKSRLAKEITEKMLQEMKFKIGVKLHYDTHHIISEKRLQASFSTYEHQEDPLLEKIANKETWEHVKDILVSSGQLEALSSSITIPTPTKNETEYRMYTRGPC